MEEDQYKGEANQLLEITNAKEKNGELLETTNKHKQIENPACNHELFYQELRVIVEDSARED